jgi:5-methylcytosine-specific restriction endonuclease McrA
VSRFAAKSQPRRFSRKQRLALAIVAGFRCEACNEPLAVGLGNMAGDHVMPFSKGGETHVRNGQALCSACNSRKGSKCDTA